jgi:hypothetical protein
LTKEHLQNISFMNALIKAFDASRKFFPASASYVVGVRRDLIIAQTNISWKKILIAPTVFAKISDAASTIERYKRSSKYSEALYRNAQDELIYLASKDFLLLLNDAHIASDRMFDAAYNNIFRLLNGESAINITLVPVNEPPPIFDEDAERAISIENGIKVNSGGIISAVSVQAKDDSIKIKIDFNKSSWDKNISYIDVYIDMNHIENIGISSMLDNKGYLSPSSAWEYAITISKNKAVLYRSSSDKPSIVEEFDVQNGEVSIPRRYIRGNPTNWGIQAVAVQKIQKDDKIVDFLGNNQEDKNKAIETRSITIPAIRIRK